MKVFVVTVIAPSEWDERDIVTSTHIGMQEWAKKNQYKLSPMDYHATCGYSFELKRQDDKEKS